MNRTVTASATLVALFLAACDRPAAVVAVPAPPPVTVTTPGPPGPPGDKGEPGKPGDSTTIVVAPAPASSAPPR